MKEFMLIYKGGDPEWMNNTSQEEMAVAMARWGAWMSDLQEKEQLVSGGSPLNFGGSRITKDGVVTDIAALEFKELVTGYSIVKAEDITEALAITRTCPIFDHSVDAVEVREVMQMD